MRQKIITNTVYADELKKIFDVTGHFYDLNLSGSVFKCRSLLEIKRKSATGNIDIPDIVVIMMNPGSSIPLDKNYIPEKVTPDGLGKSKIKELVPTRPDNAQYQLMRLMIYNNWDYVRVLNLSDLRNGNSGSFQTDFMKANNLDKSNPHCITHSNRKRELRELIKSKSKRVIAAWGSIDLLKDSAESVLKLDNDIIGIINGSLPNFRYASPLMQTKKEEWLKEIQKLILS